MGARHEAIGKYLLYSTGNYGGISAALRIRHSERIPLHKLEPESSYVKSKVVPGWVKD